MPVFFTGRKPDHIAGSNLLDRPALALSPAAAGGNDERLTQRMRMPRRPRTRLERHAGALNKCRIRCLKKRIDTHRAREPLSRSLDRGLRASSLISIFRVSSAKNRPLSGRSFAPVSQGSGRLAPRSLKRPLRFPQIVRREFDRNCPDVFIQAMQFRCAGDRHDPWLLRKQPGKSRSAAVSPSCVFPAAQQVDQRLIRLECLWSKTWRGASKIRTIKISVSSILPVRKPSPRGSVSAPIRFQFLESRYDFFFRSSSTERYSLCRPSLAASRGPVDSFPLPLPEAQSV